MRNIQTYDFGSLNNLGTPLLKWEMEKQRVFDSLNNLELEAFRTSQNFRTETFSHRPLSSPPARIANQANSFNFWPKFLPFLWRQLPHGDQMPGHVGFAYLHPLPFWLDSILAAFGYISARVRLLYWSTFKFQAFIVDNIVWKSNVKKSSITNENATWFLPSFLLRLSEFSANDLHFQLSHIITQETIKLEMFIQMGFVLVPAILVDKQQYEIYS